MPATYATLKKLDTQLVAGGHLPLTPWWDSQMRRFYEHPSALTFVGQVGRGGVKSHTSTKVGLNEALCGDWRIPAGERHYWAYVSKTKDEAEQRLLLLQSFLRTLGVPFDVAGDEIALRDMPRGFRVFACQVGAVSGFRCFGYSADENAKWAAGSESANPANEVLASLNAMCVTHPGARRLLISSPFSVIDAHYEAFSRGDAEDQVVANASTWIANPSITEEQTHTLEKDPRVWSREYAAQPSAAAGLAFGDPETVMSRFEPLPDGYLRSVPIVGVDASDVIEGGDAMGYCIGYWALPDPTPRVKMVNVAGIREAFPMRDERGNLVYHARQSKPIFRICEAGEYTAGPNETQADIIAKIAERAKVWQAKRATGDHYSVNSVTSYFRAHGVDFVMLRWTQETKEEAVALARRMIREKTLSICAAELLKKEMLSLRFAMTKTGHTRYLTSGRDCVSAFLAIMHYMSAPETDKDVKPLDGSPIGRRNYVSFRSNDCNDRFGGEGPQELRRFEP